MPLASVAPSPEGWGPTMHGYPARHDYGHAEIYSVPRDHNEHLVVHKLVSLRAPAFTGDSGGRMPYDGAWSNADNVSHLSRNPANHAYYESKRPLAVSQRGDSGTIPHKSNFSGSTPWPSAAAAAATPSGPSTAPAKGRPKTIIDPVTGTEITIKDVRTKQTPQQREKVLQGDRVYTCPYCDRLFSCSSNLIRHKRAHTGEKP